MQPKIFVSYAHDDTKWLRLLDPHLAGLKRHAHVEAFDDRKALGGDDWDGRIKAELAQADIFLALVTASFVGSEYINETELPIAQQRRSEGKCLIVPVLFDHCYWKLLGIDPRLEDSEAEASTLIRLIAICWPVAWPWDDAATLTSPLPHCR